MTSEIPCRSFSAGDLVLSCDPWVWALTSREEYSRYCAFCFAERPDLRTCSGCKLHWYCDAKCQTADWKKEHKVECMLLGNINIITNTLHSSTGSSEYMPVILMSKIAFRLHRNMRDNLVGLGTKASREILDSLPTCPEHERQISFFDFKTLEKINPRQLFLTFNPFGPQLRFADFVKLIEYNTFPILDPGTKKTAIGAAIVVQAPFRAMTPVCWDSNVILDFRGRKFVVHATEDIAQYTALTDLRYNEQLDNPPFLMLTDRRRVFQEIYKRACDCRKCTSTYEAEINPLKCVTPGCTERIPSDERALLACPQCGAIGTHERLQQFKHFVNKLAKSRKRSRLNGNFKEPDYAADTALREEIDISGILHADAHLRFLVGWHRISYYQKEGRFAEAWTLCKELISCVRMLLSVEQVVIEFCREIIPRYHPQRSDFLMDAGRCLVRFLGKLRDMEKDPVTRQEARKILTDLLDNSVTYFNLYNEAWDIRRKIYGDDSKRAGDARHSYEILEDAKREMTALVFRTRRYD